MAKVSPAKQSFNGGEISILAEGRTDLDRYPSTLRSSINFLSVPQGPLMRRSGTTWMRACYDEAKHSALVPFVFNEAQSNVLEFGHLSMRIFSEAGVQTYTPVPVASIQATTPLKVRVGVGQLFAVGDQVLITGLGAAGGLENETVKVTAWVALTGDITVDRNYSGATGAVTNVYISRIYKITSPFAEADVQNIRYLQSIDVVYLFCDGYRNYKLSRKSAYNWLIEEIVYEDGPYMEPPKKHSLITISGGGGNLIPVMTTNDLPNGHASASLNNADAWAAFDANPNTAWQSLNGSSIFQAGSLGYILATPAKLKGYIIYPFYNAANTNASYTSLDFAPSTWKFYGYAAATGWVLLDSQHQYLLWDNGRSVTFDINSDVAWERIQIDVYEVRRNGPLTVGISRLMLVGKDQPTFTVNLSAEAVADVNGGEGFKTTDVGRLIRVKDPTDNTWRPCRITARASAVQVTVKNEGDPFYNGTFQANFWRMGYWSDTTGWPVAGCFFEDRMWLAGPSGTPDLLCASRSGAYTDFQQTTVIDEVLDDSALVFRLTARRLARVRWISSDERGLLLGTGSQEFVVTAADVSAALTARNVRARPSTARGSANIEPAKVDRQVLFIQASKKTVREMAYVYEADGYKAPSMSMFASHIGATSNFEEMDYAQEPHSIVWFRRTDGSVVGLTYNRDENVVGWHRHDFAGAICESLAVIPSVLDKQDTLWMVMRRTVNGQTRRYIERLMRFWDFDSTLADAHFVDCAARYQGDPTNVVYGLPYLEGRTVDVLADGRAIRGLTVTGAKITLPSGIKASNILVGLQYTSFAEISRIEAGAADGTAQGKTKRIHNAVLNMWASLGGEIGKYNEDAGEWDWQAIEYAEPGDELADAALQTLMTGAMTMPEGYGTLGTLGLQQQDPYPYNVIALYPQMNTQDR